MAKPYRSDLAVYFTSSLYFYQRYRRMAGIEPTSLSCGMDIMTAAVVKEKIIFALKHSRPLNICLVFFVLLLWAFSYVAIKLCVKDGTIPPFTLAFLRFAISLPVIYLVPVNKAAARPNKKDILIIDMMAFFGIFLHFPLESFGLIYTTATNASIIASLIPVMTMLGAMAFYKEKTGALNLIGSLIAFLGTAFVVWNGKVNLNLNPAGDMLITSSIGVFAIYMLIGKRVLEQYNSILISRRMMLTGTLMFLPFSVWEAATGKCGNITFISMLGVLYLGWGCTALAILLWNRLMGVLGIVFTSNMLYFLCVITMVVAWMTLGEEITFMLVCGAIAVIAGVFLANKRNKEESSISGIEKPIIK